MSKELLLKQVEMLKERQKEENELIDKLQKQIEDIDKENKVWWTSKKGDRYYYVDACGKVYGVDYYETGVDEKLECSINMYKTREEAERVAFEQLLHRKLVKFAYENNEQEIDWTNTEQNKYFITYDSYYKEIRCDTNQIIARQGVVYFSSGEIAEKVIKEFKKDLIRYFTTNK